MFITKCHKRSTHAFQGAMLTLREFIFWSVCLCLFNQSMARCLHLHPSLMLAKLPLYADLTLVYSFISVRRSTTYRLSADTGSMNIDVKASIKHRAPKLVETCTLCLVAIFNFVLFFLLEWSALLMWNETCKILKLWSRNVSSLYWGYYVAGFM